MSKTVVHILGSLNRGGAETVALELCRRVPAHELRQVFACLSGDVGVLGPDFVAAGATIVPLSGGPAQRLFSLWRLLRREDPHIVQAHVSLTSGWLLLLARLAGVQTRIARIHSQGDGRADTFLRLGYRWLSRWALRRGATHLLSVTWAAQRFALGDRDAEAVRGIHVDVIPNGVDVDRFHPGSRDGGATPARVLHVGRSDPAKNRAALGPIARALASQTAVEFLLVGTDETGDLGSDRELLHVMGPRPDIEVSYRDADVLVLPSIREGLPGVVLESLAAGVPVVASNLEGLREVAADLRGLTLVDVAAAPETWAVALLKASAATMAEREEVRACLVASKYNLSANLARWRVIWGLGSPARTD